MLTDEIESLHHIQGFAKAVVLQTDKIFIELQKVENGLDLVEQEMAVMGFPFHFSTIKSSTDLVPLSVRIASLLAMRKVFHLHDEHIKEIGRLATKSSFFTKLVLRYLISPEKMAKEIPRHWQRHYSIGSMDPGEIHDDEHFEIVRLKDFNVHPIYCIYLSGYIQGMMELIGTYSNLVVEETKCQHKGDDVHEFRISWV